MLRALLLFSAVLVVVTPGRATDAADALPPAAPVDAARYRRVEIAPARTSIYVGFVSMTVPIMVRTGTTYSASYTARVVPYFFYSEKGRLYVDVTDAQLAELAHGNTIEFTGRGVRDDGAERRVTGKASPIDGDSGKIKVRVLVSKHIELIFNTTYRFAR
jgi:hypothetical protein